MSASNPPSFNGTSPIMQSPLNSRMMVAAIVVLFVVVFFILTLHVYAKWFWRRVPGRRNTASWRRRHLFEFTAEDPAGLNRSMGLDKSIVDSLPVFSYKLPSSEEEPLLECAVCLCEFEENEKGRLLPSCKHSFHTECIDMWFHSHVTCPLCRTVVTAPVTPSKMHEVDTSDQGSSSPLPLLRNGSNSHMPNDGVFPPPLPYPNNVLFWGNHNHVSSQLSSPGVESGGSSSTRSLPQISIEIPRRPESFSAPRCMSLSMSRCPSVDIDQECSSQRLKSPSIRMSIKRLLSRERSRGRSRVSPSVDQECGEPEEEAVLTTVLAV